MTLDWCFHLHKIRHTETGYGLYRWFTLFTLMLFTLLDFGETAVSSEFADAEEVHFKVSELKKKRGATPVGNGSITNSDTGKERDGDACVLACSHFCVHAHISPARRLSLSHACILLCSVV